MTWDDVHHPEWVSFKFLTRAETASLEGIAALLRRINGQICEAGTLTWAEYALQFGIVDDRLLLCEIPGMIDRLEPVG